MKGENVVKGIQIKNFRSLKDTGIQTLSPITLLVGENSSGKSTFLRAFPLLKQSISKRTSGPILWAGDVDDYVDFGSFEETATNDDSSSITFRFKFDMNCLGYLYRYMILSRYLDHTENSDVDSIDYEITISSIKGRDFVSRFKLSLNSINFYSDVTEGRLCINDDFVYTEEKEENYDEAVGKNARPVYGFITASSKAFGFVLPNIDPLWHDLINTIFSEDEDDYKVYRVSEVIVDIGNRLSQNEDLVKISDNDERFSDLPSWYSEVYNRIVELITSGAHPRLSEEIKLCYLYRVFSDIDEYIVNYFKQVHYIAPLRATAERYYRLRNLAVDEVDYQGKNLAIFINSLTQKQLREFHLWTSKYFGFTVNTQKNKGHLSLQIRLVDTNDPINLSDTGFGYSQVLPIITQIWELSTRKVDHNRSYYQNKGPMPLVVAIEQPELHLHPAVQAKLARAFIACIQLARDNGFQLQLLLETHSETIVNYLGRAVAKGLLDPDDISVVLFDKQMQSKITTVRNSKYDQNGFLENWPYGFFEAEE